MRIVKIMVATRLEIRVSASYRIIRKLAGACGNSNFQTQFDIYILEGCVVSRLLNWLHTSWLITFAFNPLLIASIYCSAF